MAGSSLDRWLFEEYRIPWASLRQAVWAMAILMPFFETFGPLEDLRLFAGLPDDFYAPPPLSIGAFLPGFPGPLVLCLTKALAIGGWLGLFFCGNPRVPLLILGTGLLVQETCVTFAGKIDHAGLFMIWGCLFLGLLPWHQARDAHSEDRAPGWPIALLALVMGFGYFSAGLDKATSDWIDPTYSTVKELLLQKDPRSLPVPGFWRLLMSVPYFPFWKGLDWSTIVFEMAGILAIARLRWFRYYLCVALTFHCGILLGMGISFAPVLVGFAIFVPWEAFLPAHPGPASGSPGRLRLLFWGASTALVCGLMMHGGHPLKGLLKASGLGFRLVDVALLLITSTLAVVALCRGLLLAASSIRPAGPR